MESLYVHFPFCESKCHYCDFYSLGRERTRAGDADGFARALRQECELRAGSLAPRLKTIFFGGGTPSMTPAGDMARALEPLELGRRVTAETEWTMEANPSSVTEASLREYRALGVNRISMGVQALRPDLLQSLGRVHSREAAISALEAIFSAGFTNVSVDLLCGVPGQEEKDVSEAIDRLTSFPVTHLSCYLLTLPPHHRMFPLLPDEDAQLSHLLLIDRELAARGFEHYEISNFAKPGHRARHNLAYWTGQSYLGLGPSAHSFEAASGLRWKNVSSLHKYGSILEDGRLPTDTEERLTDEQRELERWMLALRLDDGIPSDWLDTPARRARALTLQKEGLLEAHPAHADRHRLTPRGFALSDQVIAVLI
jgi:oxygen-independent coproporphyrinogen-3 oxidase